jgi:predicted aspartyl protease
MGRGVSTFRQRDVTAAVKAVVAAGVTIARVEVDKEGKIVVIASSANEPAQEDGGRNEWDSVE